MGFGLTVSLIVGSVWIGWFVKKYVETKNKVYLFTLIYPIIYILANIPVVKSIPYFSTAIIVLAALGAVPSVYLFIKNYYYN